MQNSDRLVITIDPKIKKIFIAQAREKGMTVSFIIRDFITNEISSVTPTKKAKTNVRRRRRVTKGLPQ